MAWAGVALVILALLVASLALVAGAIRRQYAPAFGLAETGLVAFANGDDIVATKPDGTPSPLITGDGCMGPHLVAPRRPFRLLVRRAGETDPASLWWRSRRLEPTPRRRRSDLRTGRRVSRISWSPDDQQLAFADAGVLYVVNADGTGLHGHHDPTNEAPRLVAGRLADRLLGATAHDAYNTTSLWVITPDGLTDQLVIPAEGGNEIGVNTNPSWSPDARSLLAHTGGDNYTTPNSISIASRDAAGTWSHSHIVQGSTWNYLPAWSTTGTQFTFLRAVDGTDGDYLVMVANADGTNIRSLSTRHVALATPCWTPDDLFIRAASLVNGTDPKTTLLPLDGTEPVDIPWLGDGQSAGCYPQRLAP